MVVVRAKRVVAVGITAVCNGGGASQGGVVVVKAERAVAVGITTVRGGGT